MSPTPWRDLCRWIDEWTRPPGVSCDWRREPGGQVVAFVRYGRAKLPVEIPANCQDAAIVHAGLEAAAAWVRATDQSRHRRRRRDGLDAALRKAYRTFQRGLVQATEATCEGVE